VCVNTAGVRQARLDAAAKVPRALRARAAQGPPEQLGADARAREACELRICLAEVLEREVRRTPL